MPEKQGAFPAALCGALTALSENYGTICSICCALILLDLLTGLAKAKIQGRLNSDTLCPHYTSAGIRCKSCPCGEQFSGGPLWSYLMFLKIFLTRYIQTLTHL